MQTNFLVNGGFVRCFGMGSAISLFTFAEFGTHLVNGTIVLLSEIAKHRTKHPSRLTAILLRLSEKLKSDPTIRNRKSVKSFWDEEQRRLEREGN